MAPRPVCCLVLALLQRAKPVDFRACRAVQLASQSPYTWIPVLPFAAPAFLKPRRLTFLIATLAVSGAGGVFAVANLGPGIEDEPVQQVIEVVSPVSAVLPSPNALDAPAALPAVSLVPTILYRTDLSRASDGADSLLRRLGIADLEAAAFLRTDPLAKKYLWGRAGRQISAQATDNHGLRQLTARWVAQDDGSFSRLVVERSAMGWVSHLESAALQTSTRLASGTIQTSLFAATDDARLPDSIAVQIAEIFSGDIDFHRALRKGDRFSLTYETLEADGEPIKTGRVLSAEFVNNGKKFQAMWFANPDKTALGKGATPGAYYTLDGMSLAKTFLASPLEFSRVSSGFGMRTHPIARDWRAHKGVDYSAPLGTPIRAVSHGVVEFAGQQRGYGNVVIIDHGKGHTTLYAHLNSMAVRKGEKISQSQHVGTVGRTGWATGPHLHFEFRIDGEHQDPLAVLARQGQNQPLAVLSKAEFAQASAQVKVALVAAASLQRATAQ